MHGCIGRFKGLGGGVLVRGRCSLLTCSPHLLFRAHRNTAQHSTPKTTQHRTHAPFAVCGSSREPPPLLSFPARESSSTRSHPTNTGSLIHEPTFLNAANLFSPLGSFFSLKRIGGGGNSNGGNSVYTAVSSGGGSAAKADDHHRPLPLAAEPPIGAPLRPRHHVCRDRLSAAAAAALLRGADGGGGGWRGGAVVTFAGSSGAGKACLAAEVVGRRDVRAKFGDGVLWLQVCACVCDSSGLWVCNLCVRVCVFFSGAVGKARQGKACACVRDLCSWCVFGCWRVSAVFFLFFFAVAVWLAWSAGGCSQPCFARDGLFSLSCVFVGSGPE